MIAITDQPICSEDVFCAVSSSGSGASVHFIGTVRDDDGIDGLFYECYESMAKRSLEEVASEARRRWPEIRVAIVHRVGWVPVGEASVVVAASAPHRREAFSACQFVIDTLKEVTPIWKREMRSSQTLMRLGIPGVTGIVLAGGRSKRFGTNKALAPFRGVSMIERVVGVMGGIFEDLRIVTNTPATYRHLKLPILTDWRPYQGPVGGLLTALRATEQGGVFVVGCDMPLLDPDTLLKILGSVQGHDAAIAVHGGRPQYLLAYYSRDLLPLFEEAVQKNSLALRELCRRIPRVAWVSIEGGAPLSVNTPRDLERLEEADAR